MITAVLFHFVINLLNEHDVEKDFRQYIKMKQLVSGGKNAIKDSKSGSLNSASIRVGSRHPFHSNQIFKS